MTNPVCQGVSGRRMIRRLFIVPLMSVMSAVVLFAACASIERLTVSEYAEFCADGVASARSLIEPESVTWGDLIRLGEPSLERLRAVEPPGELAEFHRASIKTLDFVVGVAEEHPAEEPANPLAFGSTPFALRLNCRARSTRWNRRLRRRCGRPAACRATHHRSGSRRMISRPIGPSTNPSSPPS